MRNGLLLFCVIALAQWALPLWTIRNSERILHEGTSFKFRTAPVDPHDPFRGEYVTLRFAMETEDLLGPQPQGQQVFAVLTTKDGEAAIEVVLEEPPVDSRPYIRCMVDYSPTADTMLYRLDLPFERFYLEQGKGTATETLMNQQAVETGPELPAYAVVSVLDGEAVIEDLIIGDRSIHRWIEQGP